MAAACNDSKGYDEPGPRPLIISVAGPKDSIVQCNPEATGGACPVPVSVTFRLPEDQFIRKAYVRFQGDGSDDGVDRGYPLESAYGKGDAVDTTVTINAAVPATILRAPALFTYTVRLVTGLGEESSPTTLTISVTE